MSGMTSRIRYSVSIIILLVAITVLLVQSPAAQGNEQTERAERLRKNIVMVYEAFKDRDFDRFLDFFAEYSDKSKSRLDIIEQLNLVYPDLIEYNILEMTVSADKAKAVVKICATTEGIEVVQDNHDHWVYRNNDWYLVDFGKMW
jgi:hypothetical protein